MSIAHDLMLTARGRLDRPSKHRPFAICVAPDKRKALYDEMQAVRSLVGAGCPMPYELSTLKVCQALIGSIHA